jgi:dihydroorotate dehydrogenase electron transfer subunit
MVAIKEVRKETASIRTFVLDKKIPAAPGQFAMLWLPGVGEKPFSFSKMTPNAEFSVKKVGDFTEALFKLKAGDRVGVRGPYGRGFSIKGKNVCVAGGGVGFAPLRPLIDELIAAKKKVTVIQGASCAGELMWLPELKKKRIRLLLATDDGTCGSRGSVCDVLHSLLEKEKIDQVYSCGPEVMLKVVSEIALRKKVPCQLSLERYMKCGCGLCGQCCIDPSGERVCKEGPVFSAAELQGSEFGEYKRDASGSKVEV